MKGLLITPAGANGEGPQLTQATAGEPLLLQTRVYSYRLADMPAGSTVVVQFYAQPWDPNQLIPAGNAVLIEQVELAPLPGFNSVTSGGTTPNWALASTTSLDTAPYGGQYVVFWVDVTIDIFRAIDELTALVRRLPHRNAFAQPLLAARAAFENGARESGLAALAQFRAMVEPLEQNVMTASLAGIILPKVDEIAACGG